MAAVALTAVSVPKTGYNLTDSAGFTTLVAGSGNGASFDYQSNRVLILKNDTGGAAVFTVKITQPAAYTALGITIPSPTITVATGKTWLVTPDQLMAPSGLSTITIECDVAGKALVGQLA